MFSVFSSHLLVLGKAQRFKKLAIFGTMGGYERKVEGLSLWGRRDRVREGVGCCTKKKWKFRERGRKVLGFLKLQGSGLCYFNFCYLILYYYLSETVRYNIYIKYAEPCYFSGCEASDCMQCFSPLE